MSPRRRPTIPNDGSGAAGTSVAGSPVTTVATSVITEHAHKHKLKKPPLYRVLFHNDNYTTMEFVVWVLQTIFHKSEAEAVLIMMNVHERGVGVAGVFTKEVAETKVHRTHELSRQNEYPLKLSFEPEEG